MNFGEAIQALKQNQCVARSGWNGKNMHLYLEDQFLVTDRVSASRGTRGGYEPCIVMFTAQGRHQPGWLASQADMLSDDWVIVTPKRE